MYALRVFRMLLPRRRVFCTWLITAAIIYAGYFHLHTPKEKQSKDISHQRRYNHNVDVDQGRNKNDADERTARLDYKGVNMLVTEGESSVFPNQWKEGIKDPFYNLTMAGSDNSPGQDGAAVVHIGAEKEEAERRFKENNFDIVASDRIPLNRRVRDFRHQDCNNLTYDTDLPSTSIIVIFYNEAPSVLLRTVTSLLNRTPHKYLHEIIMVDDHSDHSSIKDTLPSAVKFLFPPLVKLTRNNRRLGLIKARMAGSDKATGDVLVFFDSHVEVGPGWLEPLLHRIKQDDRVVALPAHDTIVNTGFEFSGMQTSDNQGTFNWGLLQQWQFLPDFDRKLIKTKADPVRSPTMSGCLFSISRRWWEHLGRFDPGYEVWGAENLELSFKTWMCGGRMEIIPCSHVAHLFRSGSPHKGHVDNYYARNQKRLADVWLDEYKEIVYLRHPELVRLDSGDISGQVALRKRLQCHPFKWFLENVVPDLYVPSVKIQAGGGLKTFNGRCVDTMQKDSGIAQLYHMCHFKNSQNFHLTDENEVRGSVEICLQSDQQHSRVVMSKCDGNKNQIWSHAGPNTTIKADSIRSSNMCITVNGDNLELADCNPDDIKQLFYFQFYMK